MLTGLEHYTIRTTMLEETKDFYVEALGLTVGERAPLPFPGYWLYVEDHAVVHLIGLDPDNPEGLNEYLGEVDPTNLTGSGAIDHLAFRAENPEIVKGRIEKFGVDYRDRVLPGMDLYQIFLEDPNDITIELNYFNYTE